MEDPDDAMVPVPTGGMPITVYPPLPPLTEHDLRLTQEMTTRTAVIQGSETRRQVEALAQHSAAAHQWNAEQIGQVQQQQDRLAAQTSEYLQAQSGDQQTALAEQQVEMRRQMDEHRKYMEEQFKILKAAEEAVGLQGQRLETLAEAVQPHLQTRWGAFAQGAVPPGDVRPSEEPAVTVAAGLNLPVPPIYRGRSKKEKRDFMDSYAIYTRRIRALNQGTQAKLFVMPLSACIEQGTMVRICGFELFKDEKNVTEAEWRDLFLSADNTAYKTLDKEVKFLCMDTELQDAESRLSRLMAEFYDIIDRLNMEDVVQTEPKKVVGYLVEALRPPPFKSAVKDQLSRQCHKPTKANLAIFLTWLRPELESYIKFEAHISAQARVKGSAKPAQLQNQPKRGYGVSIGDPKGGSKAGGGSDRLQSKVANIPKMKLSGDRPPNKCFKCGDPTHGVFQCRDVASPAKAKEIYEANTGKKVFKPVLAVAQPSTSISKLTAAIPCWVMDAIETEITLDSAAEVSMVTTTLLKQLAAQGSWIKQQDVTGEVAVTGVGETPVPVKSKVQLDLKFSTPGGSLVLRNVICWVTENKLPPGVGNLLLSRWIMERLGYSPEKLLAAAQRVSTEWDMSDVDDRPTSGIASILAYSENSQTATVTEEERAMEDDEDRAYFPEFTSDIDAERQEVRALLFERVEEARQLGATAEFCDELQAILMEFIDVFRIIIGRDPLVDMPPMEVTLKPGSIPARCKARRYSPLHREFLKKHINALVSAGLCYRNPRRRWCSPPHVVSKPEAGSYRMTVDVRGPNSCVESVVWPMPILEAAFEQLRGSSRYFSLDFFKGFWQFAMALMCQEIYSILTEEGVTTPTRVLMGGTNSVAYVQSTVQQMFDEVFNNGLMIWIDDLLGYDDSDEGLLALLKKVLSILLLKDSS